MSDRTGGRLRFLRLALMVPWHVLRFLFWPLLATYEHKARRSLSWRLAESHLLTVFLSVVAISVIGGGVFVIYSFKENPVRQEPVLEAQVIAEMLYDLDLTTVASLSDPSVSALLAWIQTGGVGPNVYDEDITLVADLGKTFQNIKTITIINGDNQIIAASDPNLIGRSAIIAGVGVLSTAVSALAGDTDTALDSVLGGPGGRQLITGSYPIFAVDAEGNIDESTVIAAIVVDKTQRTIPDGWNLVGLSVKYVAQIGLTIAVLVGIPAIPVGTVIGIRRARGIAKPVQALAQAATAIAAGDLGVRADVQGEDEIAALGRSFNRMADRLQASIDTEADARARAEQLLAANRELVANVSHELRTPVALVRSHLEALESDPSHFEDYVRVALRETDRLERLVNDLFHLSRLENKTLDLEVAPFDAGAAVREAYESLVEPARRTAGITMMTEIGDGDLTCLGDRARLVQVLQNLIRNAIRFTPEGGIILVGAHADGERIAFTIRDTGIGIAPEDLPRVFERFWRSDGSRSRQSGGAGLGLAIAKELVEQMGGTIIAESELDEGSVFTIHLPRATTAPPPADRNGAIATPSAAPAT